MDRHLQETAVSGVFASLAGVVLWPPGGVYWTPVATAVGETITLIIVATAAFGLGAIFAWLTGVSSARFAAGDFAAYTVGMVAIEVAIAPDSPVHLAWYAGLAACLAVGAGVGTVLSSRQW
ncbi:hypothetical protein [Haloplanus sp.]|uniref:hypothetical protein n=1 Tax=Haloplanus sp. TaxID=1961696 RepID=UPI002611226B|nr:hypothetical protein [Haloplanus sp.]